MVKETLRSKIEEKMILMKENLAKSDNTMLLIEFFITLISVLFLLPLQSYFLASIFFSLEIGHRFRSTSQQSYKGNYVWFPTFVMILYATKLSPYWGMLLLVVFSMRLSDYIIDYYEPHDDSDLEEEEDEKKNELNLNDDEKIKTEEKVEKYSELVKEVNELANKCDLYKTELNELSIKRDLYDIEIQKLRDDYNNLKIKNDLCEIELQRVVVQCNKAQCSKKEAKDLLHSSLKFYAKQLLKWEEEKGELIAKLKSATETKETKTHFEQLGNESDSFEETRFYKEEEEENKADEESSNRQLQISSSCALNDCERKYKELSEEKNRLEAELFAADSAAENYKACWEDIAEHCCLLMNQNIKLSNETLLAAEHFSTVEAELEDECQRLVEEKTYLSTELSAAKAAAELYKSSMHNC